MLLLCVIHVCSSEVRLCDSMHRGTRKELVVGQREERDKSAEVAGAVMWMVWEKGDGAPRYRRLHGQWAVSPHEEEEKTRKGARAVVVWGTSALHNRFPVR